MKKSLWFFNPFFSNNGIKVFLHEFGFTVLVIFIKCLFFFFLIILDISIKTLLIYLFVKDPNFVLGVGSTKNVISLLLITFSIEFSKITFLLNFLIYVFNSGSI